MKKVLIVLDEDTGKRLTALAKEERRSVKATAEKLIIEALQGEKK